MFLMLLIKNFREDGISGEVTASSVGGVVTGWVGDEVAVEEFIEGGGGWDQCSDTM